jgi:hypothetical protein
MISKRDFDDIFLPGLVRECEFFDRTIYHLDGPGALHHLDSILGIEKLDAVQWVCGAGNESFEKWLPVYKKIQDGGKAMEIFLDISNLDVLFENLKPGGVWIGGISGVDSIEDAQYILKRVEKWA